MWRNEIEFYISSQTFSIIIVGWGADIWKQLKLAQFRSSSTKTFAASVSKDFGWVNWRKLLFEWLCPSGSQNHKDFQAISQRKRKSWTQRTGSTLRWVWRYLWIHFKLFNKQDRIQWRREERFFTWRKWCQTYFVQRVHQKQVGLNTSNDLCVVD